MSVHVDGGIGRLSTLRSIPKGKEIRGVRIPPASPYVSQTGFLSVYLVNLHGYHVCLGVRAIVRVPCYWIIFSLLISHTAGHASCIELNM